MYTIGFGAKAGVFRIILTPFFHAATTAFVGYFLINAKLKHKSKLTVVGALAIAVVAHGLYDFGLFAIDVAPILVILSIAITIGGTISLFVLYHKATEADQTAGLSVVGNNEFCRSCGKPNPERKLYCQYCGKYA